MQIGETPSDIINRREQVHKLVELEHLNEQYNEDGPLVEAPQVQQKPLTCLSRLFGNRPNIQSSEEIRKEQDERIERIPDFNKDEFDQYEEAWFEKYYKVNIPEQTVQGETPNQIVHTIQPDDTIEGLELQYGVPASRIRNYNHLQTNDIYYLKQIIIPDPTCDYQKQEKVDWPSYLREIKLNLFIDRICKPEDKSKKVAFYYLDLFEWNMKLAIKEYQQDYEFEQSQKKVTQNLRKNKVAF